MSVSNELIYMYGTGKLFTHFLHRWSGYSWRRGPKLWCRRRTVRPSMARLLRMHCSPSPSQCPGRAPKVPVSSMVKVNLMNFFNKQLQVLPFATLILLLVFLSIHPFSSFIHPPSISSPINTAILKDIHQDLSFYQDIHPFIYRSSGSQSIH